MATKKTTKKSTKRGGGRAATDAIALLREDHRKVLDLFERFEKARGRARKEKLAREICEELEIHTRIEEEVFYPAVREAMRVDDLLDEATVEHGSAKTLIHEIGVGGPEDNLFEARVTVLGEYVSHHIDEEQKELFPKVRKSGLDLKELGERLAERKRGLQAR